MFPPLDGGDPARGDDIREYPLSLRNVEDLLAEQGIDRPRQIISRQDYKTQRSAALAAWRAAMR